MQTYFLFGQYSSDALDGISADRTQKATQLIEDMGGKIRSIHVLLGQYDLVLIVELPGVDDVLKASIQLNKLTGISFESYPAVSVADFDKLIS